MNLTTLSTGSLRNVEYGLRLRVEGCARRGTSSDAPAAKLAAIMTPSPTTLRQVQLLRGQIQLLLAPARKSPGVNYCDLDIGGTTIDIGYTTDLSGDVLDIVSATVDGADIMGLAYQLQLEEKVADLRAMQASSARRRA
jgi:hypothetical protein